MTNYEQNYTSDVYSRYALGQCQRVLSCIDREKISKTYGCADRLFWSWKFIDFPGARFQEIAFLLAMMIDNDSLRPNSYYSKHNLVEWLKGVFDYWCSLQHGDGSFDEAYPFERSLAATAFTSFYVGQAYLKTEKHLDAELKNRIISAFSKAGDWLCHNDETHGVLSNHLAAAAAALDTIFDITSEKAHKQRSIYFSNKVLDHQSSEGWYEEYGGADPGYQTHTIFYLGYLWESRKSTRLLDSLTKSVKYQSYFVHPDGSNGGEYGSRNTRFYMPAGFEILSAAIPEAASIASFMRHKILNERNVSVQAMDPHNIMPLLNNFLFALNYQGRSSAVPKMLPHRTTFVKEFPISGILIISNSKLYTIINTLKGGVVQTYSKKNESSYTNSGIAIELNNGKRATTQGLGQSEIVRQSETEVIVKAKFTELNQTLMSPLKLIVFRLINSTAVLLPSFSYYLKKVLVKVLVVNRKSIDSCCIRKISWKDNKIEVVDAINLAGGDQLLRIYCSGRFSAIHMGSSRYFEWQELETASTMVGISSDRVRHANIQGSIQLHDFWEGKEN